ncbi:MAG: hypothetical protein L0H64_23705, partial [Pseudonocardia sp.]|nr:hypothetical protein [Pseudonocardia sp.]
MTRPRCNLSGCGRAHHGHGYCRPHYTRWRRHGDPQADVEVAARVRDGVTYWTARRRVLAARGPATEQRCGGCGGPAAVWSYDGADPDDRHGPDQVRRYSLDPDRYRALCRSCHRRASRGGARAVVLSGPDVERAVRLYRAGASARGIGRLFGVS